MTSLSRLALVALAAASLSPLPTAEASSATPTPAAASAIVSNLWAQREAALSLPDSGLLAPYESSSALAQDDAYVDFVECGCSAKKDPHPADRVVPQIPKGSSQPVFFAQVHTTNTTSHQHPWYVVAVAKDSAGHWKLAFITLGTYTAAPPLTALTASSAYTASETPSARRRMTHLAAVAAAQASAKDAKVRHTSYGATIHTRDAIEPAKDGVFGLTLPAHRVLSCYTLHTLETYSEPGGLNQDASQHNWSDLLAAGAYKTITFDNATPQCVVGASAGSAPGTLRMQYDEQIVAVTGVPM